MVQWVAREIAGFFRSRACLIAESLCLRQQLLVLQRRGPRPRLAVRRSTVLDPGSSLVLGLPRDAAHREARNGEWLASEGVVGRLALAVARATK